MTSNTSNKEPCFDARQLRDTLSHFATGVTIVTALDEKCRPFGLTVNSFTSVSLDPPLVLWCLDNASSLYEQFERTSGFVVNLLTKNQVDLCLKFASPDRASIPEAVFAGSSSYGPTLTDCLVSLACSIEQKHDAGDHRIYIGRVQTLSNANGVPMIFYGGKFRTLKEG